MFYIIGMAIFITMIIFGIKIIVQVIETLGKVFCVIGILALIGLAAIIISILGGLIMLVIRLLPYIAVAAIVILIIRKIANR